MADAFFTEQHELVRKLAREFAETELTKEVLDKVEEEEVFPEEILDKMAKAGFFGIKVPKQYGGQGGDARSYVIVMEEIARVSGVLPRTPFPAVRSFFPETLSRKRNIYVR